MLFRLSDIQKSYSGNEILRGVSFQINPGEKVGLVGRNGAGKTTVFRLITGEETPDEGEIVKINNLRIGLLEQIVDFTGSETVHDAALSAFKKLQDIEAEMRRLEIEMAHDHSEKLFEKYSDLQVKFESADGFSYKAKAEYLLLGLGFGQETWNAKTDKLSGGQKNRLGLVKLLLSKPDVLLLDEPTNHLDVAAVEWLENFLQTYENAYVVISHDRYFLDRTCCKIVEIEQGKAFSYKGNYSAFLIEREFRREQQRREFENQQAFINKTQEFIRKNLAGQKTKQAKSRRNLLERMERVEAITADKPSGNFKLQKVERAGANVLSIEDLVIGYGETALARDINFVLHRGEALGIIGANGTGKTTFLKTILGKLPELKGKILWGIKTSIGYYSQNLEDLNPTNSVIEELRRVAPLAENGELRSFLARFLFSGEDVFKRVADLSGGEKGRLALAKLIYSNVNVLVLDEPTNHLDIPSREALESALDTYPGTIITVSHDRFFLDQITTNILSFENGKRVEFFNGNYTEFQDWKEDREAQKGRKGEEKGGESDGWNLESGINDGQRTKNKAQDLSKNQRQRIENRIAKIEEEIPALEESLAQLSFRVGLPEVAANHVKLQEMTEEIHQTEQKIQNLYREWEDLLEQIA